ncbi:sequence-specific DNA binding RNA polymerase II transcription factor [Ascochyta rabiei]|uniref:Sequence-specific DNA binding RNA polymerase II transcription factor n=1 Tax=Didymella rabiei TaxID=5454 RepID=A0A163D5D1_DIDRA|nr:sequence-specific DNA binding RNA polymerase II transcription factor [Ascochyta rabiei]
MDEHRVEHPVHPAILQDHWDQSQGQLHLDTTQSTLVIRPQSAAANAAHKAPLAPKQGPGGALANARGQHSSPISGTYALRTPRGKITSIACESCRKRKSKCDGVRPKCNTCQSKNLTCVYDVAEDGKTTTQLRAHVRRLAKELEDMKSVVSLLAMAPDRAAAANWASELERNGFAHHSVDEIKRSLGDPNERTPALPEQDAFGTPGSENFSGQVPNLGASSYDGSSREERQVQHQYSRAFSVDGVTALNSSPMTLESAANALNKFGFDCAYYRRTKQELLANGWSEAQVFGRFEIDVDSLLLGFADPQDTQPVPAWCARTVNKILPTATLPVRLASTWILTKLIRWLIWPSVENMNSNPEWLMPPMGKQEVSPYDILIDLVPWPQVRRLLYQHPQEFSVGPLVGAIGITWPYADDSCHYWDIEAGCTRMTPLFESAVADLNSWTLDPKILEIMPQLEGMVPMKPVLG